MHYGFKTLRRLMLACSAIAGSVLAVASFLQAPAAETSPAASPATVAFSLPGGLYTNSISVALTTSSSSGKIHYTLNGSEPTASSTEYSSPVKISQSTLLKAKVFSKGNSSSPTMLEAYTLVDPELAGFTSNLPLVVLDTFGEQVPYGQRISVAARFIDAGKSRSSLLGKPDFAGLGELNVRGHTSLRYPKHSYHFQNKSNGVSHKESILGLPKDSDWVLYAPYSDKTFIRDILGYELSNQIGRYAAQTRLVEVFLNDSGARLTQRNYLGVYVFEEKIKRGKSRVDVQKLRPEDNAEPAITGGYIIKKDHSDQVENPDDSVLMRGGSSRGKDVGFRSSHGNQFFFVEPKGDEITLEQRTWLKQFINRFERALYDDQFKNPKTGYAAYIDADSFIDHHLLVELSKNIDGFRFSTFYYKDRSGPLKMGPIWDWNLTFGNATGRDGFNPEGWYWSQLDDRQYSWFRRLFEDPDFEQKYIDRWGQLRANQFSVAKILARIDDLAGLLAEAQARNYRRWRILGRSVWPNAYVGRTFNDEIDFLKQWIERRIEWMDRQFLAAPSFSVHPGPVKAGSKLELMSPKGKVYYTLDGTDPRTSGGVVSRDAHLYKSALVLNESANVFCRAFDAGRWSYPASAKFSVAESRPKK